MGMPVSEGKNYTRLTASGNISVGANLRAQLFGILPSSGNGNIVIQDAGNVVQGNAAIIVNTMNLTAGQFVPSPCAFTTGLNITIGGTADVTVYWAPT